MQMQRENAKQYIILREFYLQQMRIFVTQNRMDLAFFGYATSQNHTKIYQKCIRRRVRAVLTQQIYSSPKTFPAGHIGNMSKGKDAGIGEICTSKPIWFGSRSASLWLYIRVFHRVDIAQDVPLRMADLSDQCHSCVCRRGICRYAGSAPHRNLCRACSGRLSRHDPGHQVAHSMDQQTLISRIFMQKFRINPKNRRKSLHALPPIFEPSVSLFW